MCFFFCGFGKRENLFSYGDRVESISPRLLFLEDVHNAFDESHLFEVLLNADAYAAFLVT